VRRIHFIHIGKTGGTALKAALSHSSNRKLRFVLHGHGTSLADVPYGEQCIFFVRDPLARFVSGFLSRQRKGRPRYDIPWSAEEREAFTAFATPNELALALSSKNAGRRDLAEAAMRGISHVKDHYWRWLRDEDHLRRRRGDILFVGSQERLEKDVAALSAILGTTIELPAGELASHRNPAGADRSLDPQAVVNLLDWYQDDYDCLRLLRAWFPHLPDYTASHARQGRSADR